MREGVRMINKFLAHLLILPIDLNLYNSLVKFFDPGVVICPKKADCERKYGGAPIDVVN